MRKVMQRFGFGVWVIAVIPWALFVSLICKRLYIEDSVILAIQLPLLIIQITAFVLVIVYHKEIF